MEIRKCVVLAAIAACAAAGCSDERKPLPGAEDGATRTAISPSHPATPAPSQDDSGSTLLKPEGIGSQAELDHALAKLDDAAARAQFENGFQACFATDRNRRNYASAVPAMESVLQSHPNFAPAFRVLVGSFADSLPALDLIQDLLKDGYQGTVVAP